MKKNEGFTLVEVIVVLVSLSLVTTFFWTILSSSSEDAYTISEKIEVQSITTSLMNIIQGDVQEAKIFQTENGKAIIEKENGIFIFDKNDEEYDKLYVGDTGMLIIPVDYDEKASGNFDIAYDFDSAIECSWGIYEGKHALMITSKDYAYIPVRITFTENKTGNVSFTVTDKDMDADEAPVVYSYGNNNINYSVWDFHVRAISDMSKDLSGKMDLVGNRIIHID